MVTYPNTSKTKHFHHSYGEPSIPCTPFLAPYVESRVNLDSFNIDPEARIIRFVDRVAVDLCLDPVDGGLVLYTASLATRTHKSLPSRASVHTVDIIRVGIVQSARTIAVSRKPQVHAIVPLAVPAGRDVGVHVRAGYV
jgi:hypothetical protein